MAGRLTQREGSTVWSCGRGIRPDTGDNCPDLTGNTFYFKYFTRDTKFGTDHLSYSQEQGVSAVIPSQELLSLFPPAYLEDQEWRQVVRVHWGQRWQQWCGRGL